MVACLTGRSAETCYVANSRVAMRAIEAKNWSRDRNGQYKVHEPRDLDGFKRFDRHDDLIADVISSTKERSKPR
jgi:hypothetical protein